VPDGDDDGNDGGLEDHASDAPLESHIFLGHVDPALREHVHPLAPPQLLYAEVHCILVDSLASDDRDALAQHEEVRVEGVGEAYVVGGQGPPHCVSAHQVAPAQQPPNSRVIKTRMMIGDCEQRYISRSII